MSQFYGSSTSALDPQDQMANIPAEPELATNLQVVCNEKTIRVQNDMQTEDLERLKDMCKEKDECILQLKEKVSEQATKDRGMDEEIKILSKRIANLENKLARANDARKKTEMKLCGTIKKLEECEKKNSLKIANVNRISEIKEPWITSTVNSAVRENGYVLNEGQELLKAMERKLEDLSRQRAALNRELKKVSASRKKLETELKETTKKCSDFEKRYAILESEASALRADDKEKDEIIVMITNSLKSYKKDCRRENEDKANLEKKLTTAEHERERLERVNQSHMATISHFETEIEQLNASVIDLRKHIQSKCSAYEPEEKADNDKNCRKPIQETDIENSKNNSYDIKDYSKAKQMDCMSSSNDNKSYEVTMELRMNLSLHR